MAMVDKEQRALQQMEMLMLPRSFAKRVLDDLLKEYAYDWTHIERDNFQVFADVCFDRMETEAQTKTPVVPVSPKGKGIARGHERKRKASEGSISSDHFLKKHKLQTGSSSSRPNDANCAVGVEDKALTKAPALDVKDVARVKDKESPESDVKDTARSKAKELPKALKSEKELPKAPESGVKFVLAGSFSMKVENKEPQRASEPDVQVLNVSDFAIDVDEYNPSNSSPLQKNPQPNECNLLSAKKVVGFTSAFIPQEILQRTSRKSSQTFLCKESGFQNIVKCRHNPNDISRGMENIPVSFVNEYTEHTLPDYFYYIKSSTVYQDAYVTFPLARISEDDCCSRCIANCLELQFACACAKATGGEFAYKRDGCLRGDFLKMAMRSFYDTSAPKSFCKPTMCPLERFKDEDNPEDCKGHMIRTFIKECWNKCGCNVKLCGNRVVQRGIQYKLQVFWTPEGKGWGVRALEDIPVGAFVCEYAGEIVSNIEQFQRNGQRKAEINGERKAHYPVALDADWCSEEFIKDEEALCLDATNFGNVARFINHRCGDANMVDVPVEIETTDRHYYHIAYFTTRVVAAYEELTWDYCIDFQEVHPIEAFRCLCGSSYCRDVHSSRSSVN